MPPKFDRAAEDLGNSIHLEHVNVQVPDQRLATLFYVTGLGLTRDPYLMVSDTNMWVNAGRSQFHLPSASRSAAPTSNSMSRQAPRKPFANSIRGSWGCPPNSRTATARLHG